VRVENLSRDDWIFGGVGLLLVIDLLFLPWFSISAGPFTADFTASGAPDGWLGILAVLAALAVIADLALERLSPQTTLPAVANSRTMTRFVLACVAAGLVVLKFLFHIHFSLFGFGFWAAVVLAAAFVYLAMRARRGTVMPVPGPSNSADRSTAE
jgi:small-conductance mechanosensitive channel